MIGESFEGASLKIDDKNKLIKVLKGLANSKYDRLLSKGRENIIKKMYTSLMEKVLKEFVK